MAFCANCGSQADGRFCQKCGAPVGAGPTPGAGPIPPGTSAGLGMDENVAAALCYIPLIGLIFLLVDPYNKNRAIRFHAFQSLCSLAGWIVVGICLVLSVQSCSRRCPTESGNCGPCCHDWWNWRC